MQKPKYLLVDSRDRISGSSSNFRIQLNPGLEPIQSIKLSGLALPLTNYIVDSTNQNIYFSDGTDYVGAMTPGIYDYITILNEIKTAMEATAYTGTITATYDDSTFKFNIAGTIAFSLDFATYTSGSAAYLLGFNNSDTVSAASHTSDDVAHLSIPPYFYININEIPSVTRSTNGDVCTFPIFSQNISGYINYHWAQTHYELCIPGGTAPLQTMSINLKYRSGLEFNLNDTDWCMLLELSYY